VVRRAALLLLAAIGCLALTSGASAQTATPTPYPPVILNPSVCARLSGDIRVVGVRIFVLFRGRLGVSGAQGCARAGEHVLVTVQSDPVVLGSTTAAEDGSYSIEGTLPDAIRPGEHLVVVDIGDGRASVQQPITVVTSLAAATSRGGSLPRTGSEIARLVLVSLILLGFGRLLMVFARRRKIARGARWLRGPRMLLLPAPEVPAIDTSNFISNRIAVSIVEEHVSEADLLHSYREPPRSEPQTTGAER
jgi:hypothetical protein